MMRIVLIIILSSLFIIAYPRSVSADWFDTLVGNVYSLGNLDPSSPRGGPSNQIDDTPPTRYFSNSTPDSHSGIIYYSGSESTGTGSQTDATWKDGVSSFPSADSISYVTLSARGDVQGASQPPINAFLEFLGMDYTNYCDSDSVNGTYHLRGQDLTINCSGWGVSSFTIRPNTNVILFVEQDLNIESVVKVPPSSSLVFVVGGDIHLGNTQDINPASGDSSSPHIQGVYIAGDQIFSRGSSSVSILYYGGIYIAQGGFRLRRNCTGSSPCERFIYNPSYAFRLPSIFKRTVQSQREVAP